MWKIKLMAVLNFSYFRFIIYLLFLNFQFYKCEYIPPGPRYKCPESNAIIFPCNCLKGTDQGLILRCENSNLASLSVAFNNIANLKSPVENLTIYKSNIERLYGTLFYKIKVRILIFNETPIKNIDEHTFNGINRTLQELHIINSELIEFPANAFKILGNLTVLNIDGHRIQKLEKEIFADSLAFERLEKLHLVNGPLDDVPVESFQILRKLKTLDLHGNQLAILKRNQFKNLREVEVLDLSFNNLTKFESQHISDLTKLSWCNVSHNALTELARGTFARNSVLRVLNMSFNKIKRLDTNSFRGMRFLRRLYLNDNQITEVGRGTFTSITRIGTIDLARNQLRKIDFQMFSQLNYVEIIDIAENNITEIQKQSFKDLYNTKINISMNNVEKIENYAFENCINITVLDLSRNQLKNLQRNIFDSTTYATELQFSYNYLTDLSEIPLHNMTGLKVLNVSYNNLEKIPKNTFPKLYELHTIDLSYNNITFIWNAVFQNLFSLRFLNLSYNQMDEIKSPVFGTLPTLLELDLSYNNIHKIARGGLAKLTSLRLLTLRNNKLENLFQIPISLNHIDLRNNWLQEIQENTWPRMNSLLSLDLSGNRLANNLKLYSFSGLLTLQTLKLNANGISEIPYESLAELSTLQYLYLENNNITELRKAAFGKLPVVFELNLYNNNINNISARAFDGLLQLLSLNLSHNSLKSIPNEAFVGLVSLRKLDLSFNELEKLDNKTNGVLDDCLSLEMVNLSHNKISFVTRKTFPSNPYIPYKLQEIDLSYNLMPVLTYDITFGTKKVKKIFLSNNNINDIRKYVLGNLTALEILDLSSNELKDLTTESNIFDLPENLTEIYLQNNKLMNLPFDKFIKTTKLTKIDLRHNELETFPLILTGKVKNGSTVLYEGNPLKCDCDIRPIKHHLQSLTNIPDEFLNLECDKPSYISGKLLHNVTDDQLQCVSTLHSNDERYDVLPDIRFRDISYSQGKLLLKWYVTSTRDIADFYINLRDKRNQIYFDTHQAYDTRYTEIPEKNIKEALKSSNFIQACVLAKNSIGIISRWFESQCIKLPDNFEAVMNKYGPNTNYEYTLFSNNPRKKYIASKMSLEKGSSSSSSSSLVIISSSFIFLILALTYL